MTALSENFYIIGHRGAAGERFENSLEGFRHVLELGVDAIEIDIREQDSDLWVIHDSRLERLCDVEGIFEKQADPASLRLRNGEPVPSLKQVLDLTWGKLPLNIEIKSVQNLELLSNLLESYPPLEKQHRLPWNLISSFDHRALAQLRKSGCKWPLAPITSGIPLTTTAEIEAIAPWSWHFDDEYLDPDLLRHLKGQGVACMVFTVNDPQRARELKQLGVDGIFTDYPSDMLGLDRS